jgi:Protein kinase domain
MVVVKRGKWDSSDDEKDTEDDKIAIKVTKIRKIDTVDVPAKEEEISTANPSAGDATLLESKISAQNVVTEDILVPVSLSDDSTVTKGEVISTDANSPKKQNAPMDIEEPRSVREESAETIVAPVAKVATKVEHNPLHHGCRSVDEYIRLNFIDQGTYGVVFRARCKRTGKIYALKQVKIGKEAAKVGFPVTALRETNILLALKHPNIVRYNN